MKPCPAMIRPFPHNLVLRCRREEHLPGDGRHEALLADYAYPGSRTLLTWLDSDRRNFTGPWIECPQLGCSLPAGHRGDHA
jgi:hypothetical protein